MLKIFRLISESWMPKARSLEDLSQFSKGLIPWYQIAYYAPVLRVPQGKTNLQNSFV
jgi:hypothetical protein